VPLAKALRVLAPSITATCKVSAVGLALIVPTFLYIFGHALGSDYATVQATFARPIPAILTGPRSGVRPETL
jgi:hypothetical protein